jgi:hypothetical protein
MSSTSKTLADITDERQLPISYLAALITLFLFMVGERVFYSQVCKGAGICSDHRYQRGCGSCRLRWLQSFIRPRVDIWTESLQWLFNMDYLD